MPLQRSTPKRRSSRFCAPISGAASFPSSPPMPSWHSGSARSTPLPLAGQWGRCARSVRAIGTDNVSARNSSMLGLVSVAAASEGHPESAYLSHHFGLPEVADYRERGGLEYLATALHCSVCGAEARYGDGEALAILGFVFKADTNDIREAPAIRICRDLLEEGAQLLIHDPKVAADQIGRDLNQEPASQVDGL